MCAAATLEPVAGCFVAPLFVGVFLSAETLADPSTRVYYTQDGSHPSQNSAQLGSKQFFTCAKGGAYCFSVVVHRDGMLPSSTVTSQTLFVEEPATAFSCEEAKPLTQFAQQQQDYQQQFVPSDATAPPAFSTCTFNNERDGSPGMAPSTICGASSSHLLLGSNNPLNTFVHEAAPLAHGNAEQFEMGAAAGSPTAAYVPQPQTPSLISERIKYADLVQEMHLSLKEASKKLNICNTMMKHCCRKNAITRWPSRRVIAAAKKINVDPADLRNSHPDLFAKSINQAGLTPVAADADDNE